MASTSQSFNSALLAMVSDSSIEKFQENTFQIIHTTKGHLRLRLPRLKQDPVFAARLTALIRSLDFVTAVHANSVAMSLTVNFDPGCSETTLLNSLAFAIRRAEKALPPCQTTAALSQRLGVTPQALTRHRTQTDFSEWSRVRDPEGLSWSYDAPSRTFYTSGYGFDRGVQDASKGQKILQSLTQATGSRMGAAMGRMAGQAIGLLVLGAAGMAVGGEVGTFVGEIVGAELAAVEAIEVR